jgi:hypothetical protein
VLIRINAKDIFCCRDVDYVILKTERKSLKMVVANFVLKSLSEFLDLAAAKFSELKNLNFWKLFFWIHYHPNLFFVESKKNLNRVLRPFTFIYSIESDKRCHSQENDQTCLIFEIIFFWFQNKVQTSLMILSQFQRLNVFDVLSFLLLLFCIRSQNARRIQDTFEFDLPFCSVQFGGI